MCIYCNTTNYRKIYESHVGPIPKDSAGRSYEVHHIDGNRKNNSVDNLLCVSIQDHFDIHYQQRDWGACFRISKRMDLDPESVSGLISKMAKAKVESGTHHFLGGKIQKEVSRKRVKNGTHHFLGGKIQGTSSRKRVENGTHNFLDSENHPAKRLVAQNKHHFQTAWTCPHCNKSGKGVGMYTRWHGDNCQKS